MNVRICNYRTAKALDGKFPRGYARTDPIWGSWVKVVRVDGGFDRILVELIEVPGVFCMIPIKCIRGAYAQARLKEMARNE